MSITEQLRGLAELRAANHATKCSGPWQEQLWAHWPTEDRWPGVLDIYEAAAFVRVHPDTLRRACTPGRDKRARLAHQRIGASYRIRKAALEAFGAVAQREAAA